MIDVSIIIVSYNVADLLCESVASVKRETVCAHEIIVIDNGSRDDSVAKLRILHPEVRIVENGRNIGFAAANNQGFRVAEGRYLFMLNPDTVVLDGAVDKLVRFLDEHPAAGSCGPRVLNSDQSLQFTCHHFPSLGIRLVECLQLKRLFPRSRLFGRGHMTYWTYDEMKEVDWVTGCALMVRKEALEEAGFLDENYFLYTEETDLCFRMKKLGWKTWFFPGASIVHHGGRSVQEQDREMVVAKSILSCLLKTRYYFFRKNYGYPSYALLRLLDLSYYFVVYLKNLFRLDRAVRKSKLAESRLVFSMLIGNK